jgi:hypothetical protein
MGVFFSINNAANAARILAKVEEDVGKVDSLIKMLALSHLILVGVRMRWGRWIVS